MQAARYNRQGLFEPTEKQIRWHHGEAAFVLKSKNEVSLNLKGVPFMCSIFGIQGKDVDSVASKIDEILGLK